MLKSSLGLSSLWVLASIQANWVDVQPRSKKANSASCSGSTRRKESIKPFTRKNMLESLPVQIMSLGIAPLPQRKANSFIQTPCGSLFYG
jgi:hypothetical protein